MSTKAKKELIGTLKKIDTVSKVEEGSGREIHTVAVKIELIDGNGREHVQGDCKLAQ